MFTFSGDGPEDKNNILASTPSNYFVNNVINSFITEPYFVEARVP